MADGLYCTGISAFWCPIHGNCKCERLPDGDCCFDSHDCPLHSGTSTHAESVSGDEIEQRIRMLATNVGATLSDNDAAELRRFGQYLLERSRKKHVDAD